MKSVTFEGFEHIGITHGVCGNRPIILGTRIEPNQVVKYGTPEEVVEDFDLTLEQVKECYWFQFSFLSE